jgi:hypothetical protein
MPSCGNFDRIDFSPVNVEAAIRSDTSESGGRIRARLLGASGEGEGSCGSGHQVDSKTAIAAMCRLDADHLLGRRFAGRGNCKAVGAISAIGVCRRT